MDEQRPTIEPELSWGAVHSMRAQEKGGGSAQHTCGAPDVEEVVVAAGGQLLPAGRPLEPAHLLLVAPQHAGDVLADPAAPLRKPRPSAARTPACTLTLLPLSAVHVGSTQNEPLPRSMRNMEMQVVRNDIFSFTKILSPAPCKNLSHTRQLTIDGKSDRALTVMCRHSGNCQVTGADGAGRRPCRAALKA